jgi:hypothetical protein
VEHVVFFPAPDGSPAFRRVPSLEEAVRLVEHLRNVEGLSTVSVHALTEVPLAFRAYYRVEVPTDALVPVQQVAEAPVAPEAPVALEPEPAPAVEPVQEAPALALVEDVPADEQELVASNGHVVPSPASLGFFA